METIKEEAQFLPCLLHTFVAAIFAIPERPSGGVIILDVCFHRRTKDKPQLCGSGICISSNYPIDIFPQLMVLVEKLSSTR